MLNKLNKQKMPGKKALLVISSGKSTKANGYLDRTREQLTMAGVDSAVFDKIEANPLKSTVMAGAAFARENSCDFIVALGGGSVMDAGKAIAMMVNEKDDLWDHVPAGTGRGKPLEGQPLPVICITTTAGTGSEVDSWGVISNEETNEKIGCGGMDSLFPVLAIIDPELMLSVPPRFTAFQGFDALFHSTEGYISRQSNLMSNMYALTAIENISKYLPLAVADGSSLEAREHVAFGNTLSGSVMMLSSTTSEHSIEHAMSAYHHNLPHGAGLIMISLAYYQYFIDRHACDDKFIKMAQVMGKADASSPQDFITVLANLQKKCGVSDLKMSDYGLTESEFPAIADNARETMGKLFMCDPAEMSRGECVEILSKAFK